MKLITLFTLLIAVLVLSCQQSNNKLNEKNVLIDGTKSSHLGTWELIYFQSVYKNDTTVMKGYEQPLAITLLTDKHFSYQWRNSPNSGAGSYTYDGKTIQQAFTYVKDSNFVGSVLSFNMEIRNDSLFFFGPIQAVSASGDNLMEHIPQMTEIRIRSK